MKRKNECTAKDKLINFILRDRDRSLLFCLCVPDMEVGQIKICTVFSCRTRVSPAGLSVSHGSVTTHHWDTHPDISPVSLEDSKLTAYISTEPAERADNRLG